MPRPKFPALATLLLLLGIAWLITEVSGIAIDIPWLPVVIIVVATAMIYNRLVRSK